MCLSARLDLVERGVLFRSTRWTIEDQYRVASGSDRIDSSSRIDSIRELMGPLTRPGWCVRISSSEVILPNSCFPQSGETCHPPGPRSPNCVNMWNENKYNTD